MNSPAEIRSAIESAIWTVTSDVRKRAAPRSPASLPELLRSAVTRSGRVLETRGASPKRTPVASETHRGEREYRRAQVKARTRGPPRSTTGR